MDLVLLYNIEIYAFIGQNNTGKSTVLDAIQCTFPKTPNKVHERDFYDRAKKVIIEILLY